MDKFVVPIGFPSLAPVREIRTDPAQSTGLRSKKNCGHGRDFFLDFYLYRTCQELTRNHRRVGQRDRGPHESFSLVSPYSSVSTFLLLGFAIAFVRGGHRETRTHAANRPGTLGPGLCCPHLSAVQRSSPLNSPELNFGGQGLHFLAFGSS